MDLAIAAAEAGAADAEGQKARTALLDLVGR
jgi:hypothetical protein